MNARGAVRVEFTPEQLAEVRRLQGLYPDRRAALLPVLQLAQEAFGHISLEAEEYVAGLFDLSPAHVHEVVTFYTLFFREPKGRHVISVCHNLTCHLLGAQQVLAHLKERLGVEVGGTTPDGRVTLLGVECLCACEMAPMLQVDDRYEGNLTREKVDWILEGLA
ncbi:MAG: NADH-quinone oxidoreductase subunit E, NADH-quinone oxidoreductase subunit E [Candidatus Rokubacteria bacterium CSP1-6]|nr:MAG: NADH-quinone oxidoreductase subunit E, NADH-quinone oxidoreductase subunit E [Candidatus Rokubacteria bacterium CSP1-6]